MEVVRVLESVTCTVKELTAAAEGVPLMTPLEAFSPRPAGSAPLIMLYCLFSPLPPATASCCDHGMPTLPPGRVAVVSCSAPFTVRMSVWLVVAFRTSTACTVMVKVAAVCGVPESTPAVESVRPGMLPEVILQLYGPTPPVTAKVWL